jgi:transposase
MKITTIGVDLAKQVFQLHCVDDQGRVVLRKAISRSQFLAFFIRQEPCLIGMEACGSAHHWARKLIELGHTVKLMAPQFVKPFVKTNKNDAADAEAICEAVTRPNMRFVPVKTTEQQALLSLHRARQGYVKARTAQANQIRGLLNEFGIVLPQGLRHVMQELPGVIDQNEHLPASFKQLLFRLHEHLALLDVQVAGLEREIKQWHSMSAVSRKLAEIPGIGPITASALVASIGDARNFHNGRQLAAWLGLVPKQHSSGGKPTLLGISKHGDSYLRTLLIHGARAVLLQAERKASFAGSWLQGLLRRRNKNIAAVALANKNARIVWALLVHGEQRFRDDYSPAIAGA